MLTLLVNASNLIRLDDSALASNGLSVDDADVAYALFDAANDPVADDNMPFVNPGRYERAFDGTGLIVDATYWLELTAEAGAAKGFWRIECTAQYQDES